MTSFVRSTQPLLLGLVLLCGCLASAMARDTAKANAILLKGTSPYEDMVEFALAKNSTDVAKSLAKADGQAAAMKAALPPDSVREFERLLLELHNAAAGREQYAIAVKGVEMFRLLIDNLEPENLRVPKEVVLLDYAGFRLHVLAAAPTPDWDAIRKSASDAVKWWDVTKSKVKSKSLRHAVNSAIRGLQDAAETQNLSMLHFAAQMDLDLVDLLENYFENKR